MTTEYISTMWDFNLTVTLVAFADGKMHSPTGLTGSAEVVVEAELSGGDGEAAWQHAQLFRQSLKDTETSSFEILVQMEGA